jgi:predicted porin
MKKHVMVGVAALACSAAWAQSSVTAFGFVNLTVGKNAGSSDKGVMDGYGSRLGFKGEEDLGNGLKASFYLEHRLDPDTGAAQGPFWKGGSWVGLGGGFGKVTLGRWWSQAFLKSQYASDPFGMGTVDVNYGTVGCGVATGCAGAFWVDNSVTYEFSASGFSVGAQVAEAPAGGKRPFNFGASYGMGGLYVGFGHERHEAAGAFGGDATWNHATVNYDFGVAKLFTGFGTGHSNADVKVRNIVVGVTAPVGPGTLIGAYNQFKEAGVTVRAKASVGYQYPLSKRTKLYATLTNDSKVATSKTGYDLGIFHSF